MTLLDNWNALPAEDAIEQTLACCGSLAFASALVGARPYARIDEMLQKADSIWCSLGKEDWLEAFACHPRIGESRSEASRQFATWSKEEQSQANKATTSVLTVIADRNRAYEAKHGFIYIVCASGRSADELLAILNRRIGNPTAVEIKEAAEQQRQITHLRLRKWLTT